MDDAAPPAAGDGDAAAPVAGDDTTAGDTGASAGGGRDGTPLRAFRIAYDGRPFYGFQRQPDVPTVEGALFDALQEFDLLAPDADRPAGYAAAGRTDAGVSAVAQTVAFAAPDWVQPRVLNSHLPGSVRAWASAEAPPDFHATHDARGREYTYHLYAPSSDRTPRDDYAPDRAPRGEAPVAATVDDARARAALDALRGEHDFHNFTPDETGTVRELSGDLRRDDDFLVLRVAADGFARELVRRLVTLIRAVGTGDADLAKVDRALASEPLSGPEGIGPAPPEPLVLTGVDYAGLDFERDAEAFASARTVFEERRIEALARSQVVGTVLDGFDAGRVDSQ